MTSVPPDDEIAELVRKIQEGKDREESARRLFAIFSPSLIRFFTRFRFSHDESRDLTQDVLFRVFKSIAEFRHDSRFESWLFEIATNIYRNEIRRRRTGKRDGQEIPLETAPDSEHPSGQTLELPSPEPDALASLGERERQKILRTAIAKMPPQMRLCCEMRYVRGLKYQEIATLMKISIDTVKAHLHQARKRLMAELGNRPGGVG